MRKMYKRMPATVIEPLPFYSQSATFLSPLLSALQLEIE